MMYMYLQILSSKFHVRAPVPAPVPVSGPRPVLGAA